MNSWSVYLLPLWETEYTTLYPQLIAQALQPPLRAVALLISYLLCPLIGDRLSLPFQYALLIMTSNELRLIMDYVCNVFCGIAVNVCNSVCVWIVVCTWLILGQECVCNRMSKYATRLCACATSWRATNNTC